jgi:hypothetical protein
MRGAFKYGCPPSHTSHSPEKMSSGFSFSGLVVVVVGMLEPPISAYFTDIIPFGMWNVPFLALLKRV